MNKTLIHGYVFFFLFKDCEVNLLSMNLVLLSFREVKRIKKMKIMNLE